MTQLSAITRYARTELSDEGRAMLAERLGEKAAKGRGYSFARAGSLWVPKRRQLECWGSGTAGSWATRNMSAPRDTPLTLAGFSSLESWHYAGRGLTLGATLRRGGTAAPADVTITAGSRVQSLGLKLTTSAGALGAATYAAYIDGGGSPIQTGTTGASVVLAPIGLTVAFPAGTYSADNVYEGVTESWANLTPKTRTLLSVGAPSAQPLVIWQAQNGRPVIHSAAGTTGHMQDTTSDWAAQVASGTDKAFTVFLVAKTDLTTPAGNMAWISFDQNAAPNPPDPLWFFGCSNTTQYRSVKRDDTNTTAQVSGGTTTTVYHVFMVRQNGTTLDLRADGAAILTASAQNLGATTLDVAAFFARGGGVSGGSNAMAGSIGEAITYSSALSDGDALVIENYLRNGWAI